MSDAAMNHARIRTLFAGCGIVLGLLLMHSGPAAAEGTGDVAGALHSTTPLSGAQLRVCAERLDALQEPRCVDAVVGAEGDGDYLLRDLAAGEYAVTVEDLQELHGAGSQQVRIEVGTTSQLDFELTASAVVTGTIAVPMGATLAADDVYVLIGSPPRLPPVTFEQDGPARVRYRYRGLRTGTYVLRAGGGSYAEATRSVSVVDGQVTAGQDVVLDHGGMLSGTIRATGASVTDGWVRAWLESGGEVVATENLPQPDGSLAFRATRLRPGDYTVRVSDGLGRLAAQSRTLRLDSGAELAGVDFTLTPTVPAQPATAPTSPQTPSLPVDAPQPPAPQPAVPAVPSKPRVVQQRVPGKLPATLQKSRTKPVPLSPRTSAGARIAWTSATPRVCRVAKETVRLTGRKGACRLTARAKAKGGLPALRIRYTVVVR